MQTYPLDLGFNVAAGVLVGGSKGLAFKKDCWNIPANDVARAISSAGEHYLDMVGVTGSIPVSPTTGCDKINASYPYTPPDPALKYSFSVPKPIL